MATMEAAGQLPRQGREPFEDDSVQDLTLHRQYRLLRSSLKRSHSSGEACTTSVSFHTREDRGAAADALQRLLALSNPDASEEGLSDQLVWDSMQRLAPTIVVACSDWQLTPALQQASVDGAIVVVRCKGHVATKEAIASIVAALRYHGSSLVAYIGHTPCPIVENAIDRWIDRFSPTIPQARRPSPPLPDSCHNCEPVTLRCEPPPARVLPPHPPTGVRRRDSGGNLLARMFSCGAADPAIWEEDTRPLPEVYAGRLDQGSPSVPSSSSASSSSSMSLPYWQDRDPAVDDRLFQVVENVASDRAHQKCLEMQAMERAAMVEVDKARMGGIPSYVRPVGIRRPTYKLKLQQIRQDSDTAADVMTATVRSEAQVLLKGMARTIGHKGLAGVEVVALTCCPESGGLRVIRRAWCSSVGGGFFYE